MRKIKFRGKSSFNGLWRTGYLTIGQTASELVIDDPDTLLVCTIDPKTIGEFTGKTDKNGNEIYEGDFMLHEVNDHKFIHLVRWDENGACFESDNKTCFVPSTKWSETHVIGNKCDNPELLKEI